MEERNHGIKIEFDDGTTTGISDNNMNNNKEKKNDKYSNIDDLVKEFSKSHKIDFFCFFSFLCCLSKSRIYDKMYLYNRPYFMVTPLIILLFTILIIIWVFTKNDWSFNGLISNIIGILMIIPIIFCFEFYKDLLFFKDEKYNDKCYENEILTIDVANKKNEIENLNNQCNELNSELLELRMTIAELQSPKNKTIDLREPGLFVCYLACFVVCFVVYLFCCLFCIFCGFNFFFFSCFALPVLHSYDNIARLLSYIIYIHIFNT